MEKLISLYYEYISKFGVSRIIIEFFDIENQTNIDLKIMYLDRCIKENKSLENYDGYIEILDNYPKEDIWD